MNATEIYVASRDSGKCCACRGAIRAGEEFYVEPFPNGGGFTQRHYECPDTKPMQNPERRVTQ